MNTLATALLPECCKLLHLIVGIVGTAWAIHLWHHEVHIVPFDVFPAIVWRVASRIWPFSCRGQDCCELCSFCRCEEIQEFRHRELPKDLCIEAHSSVPKLLDCWQEVF